MTTANWITVLVTLVALAATWGEVRARLKAVEKMAAKTAVDLEKNLASSRREQGARIGGVEDRISRVEGRIGIVPHRTNSRALGVPVVVAAAEDESGAEE